MRNQEEDLTISGLLKQGKRHLSQENISSAHACYVKILSFDPSHPDALVGMSQIAMRGGAPQAAIPLLERVLQGSPMQETARALLAEALRQCNRIPEAESHLEALMTHPSPNPDALNTLGAIQYAKQDFVAARDSFETALHEQPDHTLARNNLAMTLIALHQYASAIPLFETVVAEAPSNLQAKRSLGRALTICGRHKDAISLLKDLLSASPTFTEARHDLIVDLLYVGCYDEAKEEIQRLLRHDPSYEPVLLTIRSLGSLAFFEQSRRFLPTNERTAELVPLLRASLLLDHRRVREALSSLDSWPPTSPNAPGAMSTALLARLYLLDSTPESILHAHRKWETSFAQPRHPPRGKTTDDHRVRIGYLSPDFRRHSVAYFIEPILKNHDDTFETFCYFDTHYPDLVTARFQSYASHWRTIRGWSDSDLDRQLRHDKLDLLVDLSGHTGSRLQVLSGQVAPIQIAYCGYPATCGLTAMQYRITDGVCDPVGETDAFHTEKLLRLDPCFLVFQPPDPSPPLPPVPDRPVTFGSFNALCKLSDPCIEAWATILQKCPESRLVVKSRSFQDGETRQQLRQVFTSFGIGEERIELLEFIPTQGGHLEAYHRIDIALDSFPYTGTTTTCEALWMGVPVVTLTGRLHHERVSTSLLQAMGRGEWASASVPEYIQTATSMAEDITALRSSRKTVRRAIQESPLCDALACTQKLESLYRKLWEKLRER